jgi:hypothetical protein
MGSSVAVATELRAGRSGDRIAEDARFFARPNRLWGPPNLLYSGYRVFPVGKVRPGRDADHSPPSSALWATTGPVTALLYLYKKWYAT